MRVKLDEQFRLEGRVTTLNELASEGVPLQVRTEAPYSVRLDSDGGGFYQWSVSKYAAHALAAKLV